MAAGAEPLQVPEHPLLEDPPRSFVAPPLRVDPGPVDPGAEALHRVVQGPAERGLAQDVPAVTGHPAARVRPAGDDREQLPVLQDGHAVPFLEPERLERAGLDRRRPSGSFVCPDGMMGAWPASIRVGSGLAGAGTWFATQVAATVEVSSCR